MDTRHFFYMLVFGMCLLFGAACSDSSGVNDDANSETGDESAHSTDVSGEASTSTDESQSGSSEGIETREDDSSDEETQGSQGVTIANRWISSGENVAPLVQQTGIDEIEATFKSDLSYRASWTFDGVPIVARGTYEVDTSTTPHTITVHQESLNGDSQYAGTYKGIYQIDGSSNPPIMRYEVVLTDPNPTGDTPPTPEGGFGSTSGGIYGDDNVQIYEQQ